MMGHLKAAEFLIFNRKLTAHEALERNLVTEVITSSEFQVKAWQKIEAYSKLPKESLMASRGLLRDNDKEMLIRINKKEVDTLVGRWSSAEFIRVIMEFWSPKLKK